MSLGRAISKRGEIGGQVPSSNSLIKSLKRMTYTPTELVLTYSTNDLCHGSRLKPLNLSIKVGQTVLISVNYSITQSCALLLCVHPLCFDNEYQKLNHFPALFVDVNADVNVDMRALLWLSIIAGIPSLVMGLMMCP